MRVCSACSRENPDDRDFCECGEYLRWEPTGVVQAITPEVLQAAQEQPPAQPAPAQPTQQPAATPAPPAARPAPAQTSAAPARPVTLRQPAAPAPVPVPA